MLVIVQQASIESYTVSGIYLETRKAQEQTGTQTDFIHKIPVTCFNALPHIAHDMHAQDLHRSQLDIAWQLLEICKVLYRLQLLAWRPLQTHTRSFFEK